MSRSLAALAAAALQSGTEKRLANQIDGIQGLRDLSGTFRRAEILTDFFVFVTLRVNCAGTGQDTKSVLLHARIVPPTTVTLPRNGKAWMAAHVAACGWGCCRSAAPTMCSACIAPDERYHCAGFFPPSFPGRSLNDVPHDYCSCRAPPMSASNVRLLPFRILICVYPKPCHCQCSAVSAAHLS